MLIRFSAYAPWSVSQVTAVHKQVLGMGEPLSPDAQLAALPGVSLVEFALCRLHSLTSHSKQQQQQQIRVAPELLLSLSEEEEEAAIVSPAERKQIELEIKQNQKRHYRRSLQGGLSPSPLLPHLSLASVTAYLFLIRGVDELDTEHMLPHGQTIAAFSVDYLHASLLSAAASRARAKTKNKTKLATSESK